MSPFQDAKYLALVFRLKHLLAHHSLAAVDSALPQLVDFQAPNTLGHPAFCRLGSDVVPPLKRLPPSRSYSYWQVGAST